MIGQIVKSAFQIFKKLLLIDYLHYYKSNFSKYVVYDKSKDIPNVGREAETYLRYIIENYNCLPEYVAFLQGHPFDHLKYTKADFFDILTQYNTGNCTEKFLPFNNILHEEFFKWSCNNVSF
jgi:hypothetical protein